MKVTFCCDNCRSSFTVDAKLAGQSARCKKCGLRFVIPSKSAGAGTSLMSLFTQRAAPAATNCRQTAATAASIRERSLAGARPIGWLDAVNSQVALRPVTVISAAAIKKKQREEDNDGGPREYKIHVPRDERGPGLAARPAAAVKKGMDQAKWTYRNLFSRLGRIARWIDETSYALTVLCVIGTAIGIILGKQAYTMMGLTGIVLLSILRIWAAIANLIIVPFRKNPVHGIMFLIPPFNIFMIYSNWEKWRKPIKRVISPFIAIAAVFAVYLFVPWVNGDRKLSGDIKSRLRGAAKAMEEDTRKEFDDLSKKAEQAKAAAPKQIEKLKLNELKDKAGKSLDDLKKQAEKTAGEVQKSINDQKNK